jgi:hypothetical protein
MQSRARKAIGCAGLLAYMGVYAVLAASLGAALAPTLPNWAELAYYAVAGIIWVLPLRPFMRWMNEGG